MFTEENRVDKEVHDVFQGKPGPSKPTATPASSSDLLSRYDLSRLKSDPSHSYRRRIRKRSTIQHSSKMKRKFDENTTKWLIVLQFPGADVKVMPISDSDVLIDGFFG